MICLKKITEEEKLKYKKIIDFATNFLGFEEDELYSLTIGNKNYVLFVCGPIFSILSYDFSGKIQISSFTVDNDYKVTSLTDGDYQINIENDAVHLRHEDGDCYSLSFLTNNEEPEFEVANDGVVRFMQYNKKNDTRMVADFEHFVCGDRRIIYQTRLENPFNLTIESKASKRDKWLKFLGNKKSFYRLDFDSSINSLTYDIALMKDYGVGALLSTDAVSIQRDENFSKYYRVLLRLSDYITITGFPFTQQYDKKDIFELLNSLGLSSEVPDFLIYYFNNKEELLKKYQGIADSFKESIYAQENAKYLKMSR